MKPRADVFLACALLACVLQSCGSGSSGAPGPTPPPPPVPQLDIRLSGSTLFAGEPSLASDPSDPQRLVAAWMELQGGKVDIRVTSSSDGGRTWQTPTALPHVDPAYGSADVSVVFDTSGSAHLSYIDWNNQKDPAFTQGKVLYTRSSDGGRTWNPPDVAVDAMEAEDRPIDRPWIAVDTSAGPRRGWIYVATMTAYFVGQGPSGVRRNAAAFTDHHVYLKHSSDGGRTWSPITRVDGGIHGVGTLSKSMGVPQVGPEGQVYVLYASQSAARPWPYAWVAASSGDGGATFTRTAVAPLKGLIADEGVQKGWALAADPTRPGAAVAVWIDTPAGDPDIYLARTQDRGATWSAPLRLSDDREGNGAIQDMPWAAFGPDGRLAVAWRDRRNGGGTYPPFEVMGAVSQDGGASFGPNARISSEPSPFQNPGCCNSFLGLARTKAATHAVWGDLRQGRWQVYHGRLAD